MNQDEPDESTRESTPDVVDAALRAFWRGDAGPIDRLAGVARGGPGVGEMLMMAYGPMRIRAGNGGDEVHKTTDLMI